MLGVNNNPARNPSYSSVFQGGPQLNGQTPQCLGPGLCAHQPGGAHRHHNHAGDTPTRRQSYGHSHPRQGMQQFPGLLAPGPGAQMGFPTFADGDPGPSMGYELGSRSRRNRQRERDHRGRDRRSRVNWARDVDGDDIEYNYLDPYPRRGVDDHFFSDEDLPFGQSPYHGPVPFRSSSISSDGSVRTSELDPQAGLGHRNDAYWEDGASFVRERPRQPSGNWYNPPRL